MIEQTIEAVDRVLSDLFVDEENAGLHDVIVDLYDYQPNIKELKKLLHKLPDHVVLMAYECGIGDTVFLDMVYEILEQHELSHWLEGA